MVAQADTLANWLAQAHVPAARLTDAQRGVLQAAWHFRQQQGTDYFASRLLGHFLLHCGSGLKVAQIARLVGVSRPTASGQQGQSAKEVIQTAHHRLNGRPYGKLLPRYAGPIAEFVLTHPGATRYDVLDFIERTFGVRVSTVALHHFCKKYGLDGAARQAARAPAAPPPPRPTAAPTAAIERVPASAAPLPAPPFSRRGRSTPAPSC
jgi:transposase